MTTTTGFLHPGEMGATIGGACTGDRLWVGAGRSAASHARAERAGLIDAGSLEALIDRCDMIVAVCPPGEAHGVAEAVARIGFDGIYADANAVSPMTAKRIGEMFERFVDGGIIGPPVERPGTTRLYLSGEDATTVARRWDGSALQTCTIDGGIGAASAVKMLSSGWAKHNAALRLAINAVAEAFDVTDAMRGEWEISQPDFLSRSEAVATGTSRKAWRFEGEMHEIAATFAEAGLPSEFHRAAAEVFGRMAKFADVDPAPGLDQVVGALLADG